LEFSEQILFIIEINLIINIDYENKIYNILLYVF